MRDGSGEYQKLGDDLKIGGGSDGKDPNTLIQRVQNVLNTIGPPQQSGQAKLNAEQQA